MHLIEVPESRLSWVIWHGRLICFGIIHDECQVDSSPESSIAALRTDWEIVGQGLRQAMLDHEKENDLDILSKLGECICFHRVVS